MQRLISDPAHTAAEPSTVLDVLRRPGRPLPVAVRLEMEARLGTSLADVRLHTGQAARQSADEIGAVAYTSGNHIVIGARGTDKHTLAHELTHVIQQRSGPVAGTSIDTGLRVSDPTDAFERAADANATRAMSGSVPVLSSIESAAVTQPATAPPVPASAFGPAPGRNGVVAVQRKAPFTPFDNASMTPQNASVAGVITDVLTEYGLIYPRGGTLGNSLNLEKMVDNTGGGSAPGEPVDVFAMREIDKDLVRAKGQTNAATAMHAINHNFTDHAKTNNRPENIFMGSAQSNTTLHYYQVEDPIRKSMQSGKHGLAALYETAIINANPGTRLTNHPDILGWSDPSLTLPGAETSAGRLGKLTAAPLTGPLTHVVDTAALRKDPKRKWPKMVKYTVTPNYTYNPGPTLWPQFLKDNRASAQQTLDAELLTPTGATAAQIAEQRKAIALLDLRAHQLFPETFTCTAEYWLASYDKAAPWYISKDHHVFDAEL